MATPLVSAVGKEIGQSREWRLRLLGALQGQWGFLRARGLATERPGIYARTCMRRIKEAEAFLRCLTKSAGI